ncbi:hypothetical protein E3N88_35943 [Mikania micrantha]|uniref:Glycosyltransferase n=1 Tax=Mikania micrantha TaxID=192012 RepID=A0A5N6M551_9ASTR|nr:hypothetical protein E3N88_35943 [Mikania micrantha]
MEITGKKHVGVFTFPFASHPPLLLNVVRRLASAAPAVVFSFFSSAKFNNALFTERGCDNILPYDISDGLPEGYGYDRKVVGEAQIGLFLGVAEEEFKRGVQAAEKDVGVRVSCLVVDVFLWFSGDLAGEMKIPWVAFWTAGSSSLSAHFHTDLIRQKYDKLKDSVRLDDEIPNLIPGLPMIRFSDIPKEVIFGDLESPFATMLHKMVGAITKATAVLVNSFQELDPDLTNNLSLLFNNFLLIGPFNLVSKQKPSSKSDESCCISWLDTQNPRSVAYISFGTVCTPPPHELVALAEALEETKTPFLWSLNNDAQKHLPSGFLDRTTTNGWGKIVPWAPQVQVLSHCSIGVFVTHGGWNSVLESIGAGVPMICRSFFGDQPTNAWMIERVWRVGVRIEGGSFTKHGTCGALQLVLSSSSDDGLKQRIEALKDLAHKSVGPNGSSARNFKTLVDVVTGATL